MILAIGIGIIIFCIITLIFLKIDNSKKMGTASLILILFLFGLAYGIGSIMVYKEINYEIEDMNENIYNNEIIIQTNKDNDFTITTYAINNGREYEIKFFLEEGKIVSENTFINLNTKTRRYNINHKDYFNTIKNNKERIDKLIAEVINDDKYKDHYNRGEYFRIQLSLIYNH